MKVPPKDLNPNSYPSHPANTYTCGVTIAPRVHSGESGKILIERKIVNNPIIEEVEYLILKFMGTYKKILIFHGRKV